MATNTTMRSAPRNRRAPDPSIPPRTTPAVITGATAASATVVRVTFDTRVMPRGLPAFTAGSSNDQTVESVTAISGTELELTFTGDVSSSTMTVAEGDPAIRTPSGGFVPAGLYAISAVGP